MLYRTENHFFTTFSNFKHGYIKKFYWSSHIFHWSSHFSISRGPRTDKFRGVWISYKFFYFRIFLLLLSLYHVFPQLTLSKLLAFKTYIFWAESFLHGKDFLLSNGGDNIKLGELGSQRIGTSALSWTAPPWFFIPCGSSVNLQSLICN